MRNYGADLTIKSIFTVHLINGVQMPRLNFFKLSMMLVFNCRETKECFDVG